MPDMSFHFKRYPNATRNPGDYRLLARTKRDNKDWQEHVSKYGDASGAIAGLIAAKLASATYYDDVADYLESLPGGVHGRSKRLAQPTL
jgi:hypothetical protein